MPSITWVISRMRREASAIASTVTVTSLTASVLRAVTSAAWRATSATSRAVSALCRTVSVISAIDAEVCSRLEAWDSVRSARLRLPLARSCEVCRSRSTPARVSPTMAIRLSES